MAARGQKQFLEVPLSLESFFIEYELGAATQGRLCLEKLYYKIER